MTHDPCKTPGNLQEDLKSLEDQIRSDPANAKHRIYLFQLLTIIGDWDRALTQLNVLQDMDAAMGPMVGTYREAIQCEALRGEIFAGERSPVIFGEPAQWTAMLVEGLRLTADDKFAEAEELRTRALEAAPVTSGTIDENRFEWIADADSRLGPIIEVIINGRYNWVPFNNISKIEIEVPVDLRDLVWLPANFTWANGGQLVGLIPTRYPGTEKSEDNELKLSRKTDWIEASANTFLGLGQRILTTDTNEYSLMDIRQIDLDTQTENDLPEPARDDSNG